MHTKRKAWFFHSSYYFNEEQLYKNFMYILNTSVPSFQNDYPLCNNFWLMFWNGNAYFYAFMFKANPHPASFFGHHPLLHIYIRILKEPKGWAPSNQPMLPNTLMESASHHLLSIRPFLNKRMTHCLFSSPGGGVLPCPSITKSSCSICKGKHCRSEIGGAKCTSPNVALFICNNSKQPLYHSGWSRTDHVVS